MCRKDSSENSSRCEKFCRFVVAAAAVAATNEILFLTKKQKCVRCAVVRESKAWDELELEKSAEKIVRNS